MVCSQSAWEETSGSTVHTACVALLTPSSYTTPWPAASRDQELPQPVLPAKPLQRATFINSLLSVYRILQGKFQGQVLTKFHLDQRNCFCSFSHSQVHRARCHFKTVEGFLSLFALSAISTRAVPFNPFYSFKVLSLLLL